MPRNPAARAKTSPSVATTVRRVVVWGQAQACLGLKVVVSVMDLLLDLPIKLVHVHVLAREGVHLDALLLIRDQRELIKVREDRER